MTSADDDIDESPPSSGLAPDSTARIAVDPGIAQQLAREWEGMTPRLKLVALCLVKGTYGKAGAKDRANDLMNEAYLAILQGRRRWNRAKYPNLYAFVCRVMGSLLTNDRKKESVTDAFEDAAGPEQHPELLLMEKRDDVTFHELFDEVEAEFEEGDLAKELVRNARKKELSKAPEQAEALGVDIDRAYALRDRVNAATQRVFARRQRGKRTP